MKTSYTVKSTMPLPKVGMSKETAFWMTPKVKAGIDMSEPLAWVADVKKLFEDQHVVFVAWVDGKLVISLNDEVVAATFDKKWGDA